jgi:peptidoglycan hydrolase-like protein with peptidoglycan-binding domain
MTLRLSAVLRDGSTGPEVVAWQGIVGAKPDGVFGRGTDRLTKLWQADRGLVADGIVGERTVVAAGGTWVRTGNDPRSPACRAALRDANLRWPKRITVSDGIMGDASHQARASDHNKGEAVDITHDPKSGCVGDVIAALAMTDGRTKYVIWNRRIWNPSISPDWRPYTGSNPHTHHVHISVRADAREDDSPWPWASAA